MKGDEKHTRNVSILISHWTILEEERSMAPAHPYFCFNPNFSLDYSGSFEETDKTDEEIWFQS